jgi:hypothetical protein
LRRWSEKVLLTLKEIHSHAQVAVVCHAKLEGLHRSNMEEKVNMPSQVVSDAKPEAVSYAKPKEIIRSSRKK